MKIYRVELPDDDMEVFAADNDTEALSYVGVTYETYLEIYELDENYNEIRSI